MKKNTLIKITSFLLSLMIICSCYISAFAQEALYTYKATENNSNEIYVMNCSESAVINGNLIIPEEIDGKSVVGIGDCAFWSNTAIKDVTIPSTVNYIGEMAFTGCENLSRITLKNADCNIEYGAFTRTAWLKNQTSDYVFLGTTLISYNGTDEIVYIPYNITNIGNFAFANNTTVKKIILAEETKTIGKKAFFNCINLESINIPDSCHIEKVGQFAFDNTKWISDYHGDFVIVGTTLVRYKGEDSEVVIPNSVTEISAYAFETSDHDTATRVFVPYSIKTFDTECLNLSTDDIVVNPYLYVYKGSEGERYAKEIGAEYSVIATPGDVNLDGKITIADSRKILRTAAKLESSLTIGQFYGADIDNDGKISVTDARTVLRMIAKINDFTAEEYLSMPKTGYEALEKVNTLLSQAQATMGFDYYSYQEFTDTDINLTAKNHINVISDNFTSEKKAAATPVTAGTPEAAEKVFVSTLKNSSLIKSYTCKYSGGKYIINIILNDETVSSKSDYNGDTAKLFPVATVSQTKDLFAQKRWYDKENPSFDFSITYKDCAISLIADIKTGNIEALSYNMNYIYNFSGKINGIEIRSTKGNETASVSRHDVINYQNITNIF